MWNERIKFVHDKLSYRISDYDQDKEIVGTSTKTAVRDITGGQVDFSDWRRVIVGFIQWYANENGIDAGPIDGYYGPRTDAAWDKLHGIEIDRPEDVLENPEDDDDLDNDVGIISKPLPNGLVYNQWPTRKNMVKFYGRPGTNHTLCHVPYPLRIDWELNKTISKFSINKKCKESAERVFKAQLEYYGYEKLKSLGLDRYAGCYNNRSIRGGRSLSTHAVAAAIDFYASENRLRWNHNKALFAKPEYNKWWEIWEAEGWISLGRKYDMDFMHIQAIR